MRLYGWLGLLLLLLSELLVFRRIEPFYSWFYSIAWWSYILLADNLLLKLRGRSLLSCRRSEFWIMLPLSIFIWLVFEGYNLVLGNWGYENLPASIWERWPGYAAAFSTVLPGIFVTSDLLEHFLFGSTKGAFASETEALREDPHSAPSAGLMLTGLLLSAAPLLLPQYFFAAVWLGPIFLFDPLLEKTGLRSLSLSICCEGRRRVWSLLAGGLVCGLLWEFWNFWAGSRWIYSVPYFGAWKIFEMPLLGFLGFPPFALECWIMYHLLQATRRRCRSIPATVVYWSAIGFFVCVMFRALDSHTVVSTTSGTFGSYLP